MTPLIVIGGFLGAGKTTLLNRWLSEAQGQRIAVLVNDFGAINIDAALVAGAAGDTIALSNGCVCCSIGDDLSAALIRVLEARPRYDAIVVEASGVSDPWRIAQIALADAELELGGVVVLLDAAALPAQSRESRLADTLARQLAAADLVVLNKADLASAPDLAATRDWAQAHAPGTPRLETVQARVPLTGLIARPHAAVPACGPGCSHDSPHGHGHSGQGILDPADHASEFESLLLRPPLSWPSDVLRERLRAMPPGVLRLKGIVRRDDGRWTELQYAGRHASLRLAAGAPAGGPVIVAIGLRGQLPAAELEALFAAPVGTASSRAVSEAVGVADLASDLRRPEGG